MSPRDAPRRLVVSFGVHATQMNARVYVSCACDLLCKFHVFWVVCGVSPTTLEGHETGSQLHCFELILSYGSLELELLHAWWC